MTISSFFMNDQYVIDEKVSAFKFTNAYKVYDTAGQQIGAIEQEMSGGQKALSLMVGKNMLPFTFHVTDAAGQRLATVKRGATLLLSKIVVTDERGMEIAGIQQKWSFMKPTFTIVNTAGTELARIKGDWKGWNFQITGPRGETLGTINKQWSGAMKEIFTTADKYMVTIDPNVAEDSAKVAIVAAAITIDMVLKESK